VFGDSPRLHEASGPHRLKNLRGLAMIDRKSIFRTSVEYHRSVKKLLRKDERRASALLEHLHFDALDAY